MSTPVDEAAVRQFIEIISAHVKQTINGAGSPGVLQICRISPIDESIVPNRFLLDDVEHMVKTAIGDAVAGHNVYIEARTVRADLRGNQRGTLEDTVWVFGLVADCDADKGKGGNITVRPSLVIETSPGNFHYWYLFTRAIPADQAKTIGDAIRANAGTDQDTGVITQCYRVAGTPNYPSPAKQARGRITVEPTRIFEQTGRLWDPDELLKAFRPAAPSSTRSAAALLAMPLTRPPCRTTCSRTFAKAASARKTIRAARRYSSPSSASSSGGTGASKPLSSCLRSTRTESPPSTRSACARRLSALMAKPQAEHQSAAEALPLPPADLRQHPEQHQLRSRARRRTLRISCRPSAL